VKVLYFAWIRERVGKTEEELDPPAEVTTVADLIGWLKSRGEEFDHAFAHPEVVRVAVDRVHVAHDAPIAAAREVALFPPMTGG